MKASSELETQLRIGHREEQRSQGHKGPQGHQGRATGIARLHYRRRKTSTAKPRGGPRIATLVCLETAQVGRARFRSVLPHSAPEDTSGRRSTRDTGRRRAVSPLPVGFSFQRTSFCLAQASAGLEWAPGVLPRPDLRRLRLCRPGRVLCCSRIDPLKPSEASDGPESPWPIRQILLILQIRPAQAVRAFLQSGMPLVKTARPSDDQERSCSMHNRLVMNRKEVAQGHFRFMQRRTELPKPLSRHIMPSD